MPKDKPENSLSPELQQIADSVLTPPKPVTAPAADFEDGSTIESDGKTWYRYHVDGDVQLLRKPIDQMTDEDWLNTPLTISGVVTNRIPQELTVKFRDPQWAGRWFNKSAKDGIRVSQARFLGFLPAKREDLEWAFDMNHINDQDGAVEQGDLVLFKIHKAKLAGMIQKNFQEALARGTPSAYLSQTETGVQVPSNHQKNVSFFIGDQAKNERQGVGPVVSM